MVRAKRVALLLGLSAGLLAVAACARAPMPMRLPETVTRQVDREAELSGRAIIRSASIRVSVRDPDFAASQVILLVEGRGGYVEHSRTTRERGASLRIRIPSDQLSDTLDEIAALGNEAQRETTARDVTEQLADLEAAAANNRALRDRLRLLLERAETVEEVLKVEAQLTRLQTEIDRQEGRVKRLRSEVDLSSVSVSLERRRILGPLGFVVKGIGWVVKKLFVIQS